MCVVARFQPKRRWARPDGFPVQYINNTRRQGVSAGAAGRPVQCVDCAWLTKHLGCEFQMHHGVQCMLRSAAAVGASELYCIHCHLAFGVGVVGLGRRVSPQLKLMHHSHGQCRNLQGNGLGQHHASSAGSCGCGSTLSASTRWWSIPQRVHRHRLNSTKDRQSHRRCYGPLPRGSALQVPPVHHNGAFAWPDLRTTLCTELPPLLLGGWVLGAGAAWHVQCCCC